MEFKYENNSRKSGIYRITNTVNGRVYIGSTKRFKERWYAHARLLKTGTHQNKFFQADFDKCLKSLGNDSFMVFEILELTTGNKMERLAVEEIYLHQYFDECKQCYNMTTRAVSPDGCKRQDSETTKAKMSEITKALWKNGTYANSIASRSKPYALLSPDNILYTGTNISQFCREHNLNIKHMSALLLGKQRSHKGWKRANDVDYTPMNSKPYRVELISPTGELHTFSNIEQFAKEHSLYAPNVSSLMKGKLKTYKGWRRNDIASVRPQSKRYSYSFVSPEGVLYSDVRNLTEFAEQNNLNGSSLNSLVHGRRRSVYGWTLFINKEKAG